MFGYINIHKDELKVKDFSLFKSYYCGLCKTMGKRHNQLTRLSLNYDFTFLAIIIDSVYDEKTSFSKEGCIKNFAKKDVVCKNKALDFSADMSVILTYYKLMDDVRDNKSIKALIAAIPFYFGVKKLKGKYNELIDKISDNLKKLSIIEKSHCSLLDEAADPFASIMADIFECGSPSLRQLGYNIGRYVYIADACDDLTEDFKEKRYNPVIKSLGFEGDFTNDMKQSMENTLYHTMTVVAMEYEKLPKFKNKEILDNIIYLGIRAKADYLLNKIAFDSKNNERKSKQYE